MEWFESWFDSHYYHILYQNRDTQEAEGFVRALTQKLEIPTESRMMDLACGKGRYARLLAEYAEEVVGLDLSEESIKYAKQFESGRLTFYKHDMRQLFRINYFDFIFNLFTSFGYFKTDREHLRVFMNIEKGLRPGGTFIFDYFNLASVKAKLVPQEVIQRGDYTFEVSRRIEHQQVIKRIKVQDTETRHYEEQVRAFTLTDFEAMFQEAGLQIVEKFGNYQLDPFEENASERLIIRAIKG
ncbi:MAG: methyltransferase domain-containing protein [Bacteroidota bacterium]